MNSRYVIPRARKHFPTPVYWNGFWHTHDRAKELHGENNPTGWMHGGNGYMEFIYINEAEKRMKRLLGQRWRHDHQYVAAITAAHEEERRLMVLFIRKVKGNRLTEMTTAALLGLASQIQSRWIRFGVVNTPPWFFGADGLATILRKELTIPDNIFPALATPLHETAAHALERELKEISMAVTNHQLSLETGAQQLSERYGWIPYGYDGPAYWDQKYFVEKIEEVLVKPVATLREELVTLQRAAEAEHQKQTALLAQQTPNQQEQQQAIKRLQLLAQWTDDRKKYQCQLHYWYGVILQILGERYGFIPFDLHYLFTEELPLLLGDLSKSKELIEIRKTHDFVLKFFHGNYTILSEADTRAFLEEIKEETRQDELKGVVGARGPQECYQGKVKIVFSPQEVKILSADTFLVAPMTTPDYLTLMQQAKGFITDEGGITCHAAVMAREMNKPCIIGTKAATRILKDGDMVEVDATVGIVRKI